MRTPRRLALATAAAAAVLVLVGCSNQQPGSAATFGEGRITESQLAAEVAEVQAAAGETVDAPNSELVSNVLHRMLVLDLVDLLAQEKGIEVTQGEIDSQMTAFRGQFGTQEQVEANFIGSGIAPSQIEDVAVFNVQAKKLGELLAPGGAPEQQSTAVVQAVATFSTDLGTEVSPRYGVWDPAQLQIAPGGDDLSAPPAG